MDNAKFALANGKPAHRGLSWFPFPPHNAMMNGMREDFRATTTQKPTTTKTKQANSQQTKTKAEHHAVKNKNKKTRINNQF